ncbi:MAG: glycosyltransferase [Alistipes senegalensis]|nr:glycosyltransferase [Oxalobacter formigenes]MCM1281591.1 glycosyltransferase [Alistipes senegalensis]
MKVLHFGRFHGGNSGGIEQHVTQLLQGLSKFIHVDNLVANNRFAADTLKIDGYKIYKVPSLGTIASTAICPAMPFKARQLHCLHHYDIIHLHLPDPMSHLSSLFLPANIKLVLTWHSDIIRQQNLLKLYRPFMDRLIARADAIIAATPAHFTSSSQLEACSDPTKKHIIPFGMDFSPFQATSGRHEGEKLRAQFGNRPLIFALGRHVVYKGFEYLIRSMKNVMPTACLILGGTGPLSNSLHTLAASLKLTDRIIFTGRIADADLPAYYYACDVFCLPSISPNEAFGLVQLEAMICKKPVICCELHNGVNYVNPHNETGLTVPPQNIEALAQAINRVLQDNELRLRLSNAAYRRASEKFSLDIMCQKTLAVYQEVLKHKA